MPEIDVDFPYTPRPYQSAFEQAMWRGRKRAILIYHRRAGKDIACFNFLIHEAAETKGIYYYILPTRTQAKKVIWEGISESGQTILDYIPAPLIEKKNESELKVKLVNGSQIQLVGSNNFDSLAGTNPRGVVLSEYALQDPRIWELILSPILRKNGGWAVFNSTPRGKNFFYDMYQMARTNPDWYVDIKTIYDTGLISEEQLQQERDEGRSEEIIEQEYKCSFERGVEGSYYGKLISAMYLEDRITHVPYDASIGVETYWDLGYGDSTAIIFVQQVGQEVHIIDYYESHGEGLAHYVKILQDRGYVYKAHYGPHDIESGHLSIGKSLRTYAKELGIYFEVVPKTAIDYGIECLRSLLPRIWIDEKKGKQLIRSLENYCKKYNEKLNCYSTTPEHSWASHGADAARYMAVTKKHDLGARKLSPEQIAEMRNKYRT